MTITTLLLPCRWQVYVDLIERFWPWLSSIRDYRISLVYIFFLPKDFEAGLKTDRGPANKNLRSKRLCAVFNELNLRSVCSFQHLTYCISLWLFFLSFFWWFFFFLVYFFKSFSSWNHDQLTIISLVTCAAQLWHFISTLLSQHLALIHPNNYWRRFWDDWFFTSERHLFWYANSNKWERGLQEYRMKLNAKINVTFQSIMTEKFHINILPFLKRQLFFLP